MISIYKTVAKMVVAAPMIAACNNNGKEQGVVIAKGADCLYVDTDGDRRADRCVRFNVIDFETVAEFHSFIQPGDSITYPAPRLSGFSKAEKNKPWISRVSPANPMINAGMRRNKVR